MTCFLIQQRGMRFSNPLIGLKLSENGQAQLCKQAFSCCVQTEGRLDPKGRLFVCDVQKRLQKVQKIIDLYQSVWKKPFPGFRVPSGSMVHSFFDHFASKANGSERGAFFSTGFRADAGSLQIWYMALVTAWRFDLEPHVVSLGKSTIDQIIPKVKGDHCRSVIFVEQIKSLRFIHIEQDLELLVGWCEGAMVPLWMDVLKELAPSPDLDLSDTAMVEFQKKIRRYTESPPLSWLKPETISRLSSVSTGYHSFF